MVKPKKRANEYWKARIKRRNPAVFDRVLAGELSVRQARIKLRLLKLPTRLDALKRHWERASPDQRRAFIAWVRARTGTPVAGSDLVEPGGRLKPAVIRRTEEIMARNHLRHGDVMERMGYKRLDPRLGSALASRWKPNREFCDKLAAWLARS